MNLKSQLQLYHKHWIAIVILMILTSLAAYFFGLQKNTKPFETTLFFTFGIGESGQTSLPTFATDSIYENIQAADYFTETIQGWFKNPALLDRIAKKSGEKINISARRQEKQNLIITFDTESESRASEIGSIVKSELASEIDEYNKNTSSHFNMALAGSSTETNTSRPLVFALIGLIMGVLLGLAFAHASEFIKKW